MSAPIPQIRLGEFSDVGRVRDHNEDYLGSFIPSDTESLLQRGRLYVVADGMGGYTAGDKASQLAVEATLAAYQANPMQDPPTALREAIQEANYQVHIAAQREEQKGMGTTIVCAVIRGSFFWVAHVGDSRAYLFRAGQLFSLTRDHTMVNLFVEQGMLQESDVATHPQRHVLSQAIGHSRQVQVDVSESQPLQTGDSILLCTDGVHGALTAEQIAGVLQDNVGQPQLAANFLVQMANSAGGEDNATALVLYVEKVPPAIRRI